MGAVCVRAERDEQDLHPDSQRRIRQQRLFGGGLRRSAYLGRGVAVLILSLGADRIMIIAGDVYLATVKEPDNPFSTLAQLFREDEVVYCNLEGALTDYFDAHEYFAKLHWKHAGTPALLPCSVATSPQSAWQTTSLSGSGRLRIRRKCSTNWALLTPARAPISLRRGHRQL